MLCPYCLRRTSTATCKHCHTPLPPLYANEHKGVARDPAILSAVGFRGHGKTVFLASLLHVMERQLPHVWKGFYRQALDIESVRIVQENLTRLEQGELPQSTRSNFPRPSAHRLAKMRDYGTQDLLIYDPPGEAFNSDEGIERYAHFVRNARCVLFLVSVVDLEEPKASDLYRLLNTYVLGMGRLGAKTKRQHLIVAYTKADLLLDAFADLSAVNEHLRNGHEDSSLTRPRRYQRELEAVSKELATYTESELGAQNFANLAASAFRTVSYCTVSALGSPPEHGFLATAIEPRGVVDPLMWLLRRS